MTGNNIPNNFMVVREEIKVSVKKKKKKKYIKNTNT